MNSEIRFFLGANSGNNFVTYFKELQRQNCSMQLLIFKGGPGSGKSSLMKKVLSVAENLGHVTEAIACASDPNSLDAIIDHTASFAMMDGTAPHVEDPRLPGALQHIVYTGDMWDTDMLFGNRKDIERLTGEVSLCHRGAGSYIQGAVSLLAENIRCAETALRKREALSFAEKIIGKLRGEGSGRTAKRLLSAVSVGEIKLFSETPFAFADEVYVLEDSIGAAADYVLKSIAFGAKMKGENLIYCPCSVMPKKCDHIIFPDSRIAVVTQNKFMKFRNGEPVSMDSFYKPLPLQEDTDRRREDASHLLLEAARLIKKAKDIHDDLEAFYINAMDFSKSDTILESIISRFYA